MQFQSVWVKFSLVSACFCLFLVSSQASAAQASVYGTVGVTDYGYSFNGGSLTIGRDRVGFAGGGFYNFPIRSRFTAGVDVRGSVTPGSSGGEKAFLSARFGYVPRTHRLRPYLQVGGGVVRAKVPAFTDIVGAQNVTRGAVDLVLGLDYRLTSSLDLRAVEFESGVGISNAKEAGSASISTGIVYHF